MDGNFVLLSCIHLLVDVLNEPAGARLPPTLSPGYAPGPFLLTARASIAMTTLELPAKSVLCTPGNPITTTLQIDRAAINKSARGRHRGAGQPRKPMRPVQKPPRRSTTSAPRSTAGAAPGPTVPQRGSSHIAPSLAPVQITVLAPLLTEDGSAPRAQGGRTLGVARSMIQDNLRRAHAIGEVSRPKFRQALRGASRPTAPLHAVAPFHISVGCGACHPESKNRMREICI